MSWTVKIHVGSKTFEFIYYSVSEATGFMTDVMNHGVWIDGKTLYPSHKIDRLDISENEE